MVVLEEEHEQDILRLVAVGREPALSDNVLETTRQQLPWLAMNLCIAILASKIGSNAGHSWGICSAPQCRFYLPYLHSSSAD